MSDPHPWQEYNQHGNTCHRPDCTLTEDEHPKADQRPRGADATPPLRNVKPDVPDVRA